MTTHQPNPHDYTNLNADDAPNEANPNADFAFEQDHSEARHRTSASGDQAPNSGSISQDSSSSQNQSQPQRKELSTCFTYFYKAILMIHLLLTGKNIITILQAASIKGRLSKLEFFDHILCFAAMIIAFIGIQNKNLRKIETALTMLKIELPFYSIHVIAARGPISRVSGTSPPVAIVGALLFWYFSIYWPTKKVRDTWKTVPQEEEIRKEEAKHADPIEKLDSLKFTIYRYALLLFTCIEAKETLPVMYEDFADFPRFWGRLMSEKSYLITQINVYTLFPLSLIITFLAFEGLRRKNLDKVLKSIKLMKINLAVAFIMRTFTAIIAYYEGTLYKLYGDFLEMPSDGLFGEEMKDFIMIFLLEFAFLFSALTNYICIYITSQVRDILKAHERARYTL